MKNIRTAKAKPYRVKCAICGDKIDPESPFVTHTINPNTLRVAWMENACFEMALDDLDSEQRENFEDFFWANSQ